MVPVERRRYTVSCLQFVERKHLQATLCSTGYRASEMVREPHRQLSAGDIVNNDFVKSFGAPKGWQPGGGGCFQLVVI